MGEIADWYIDRMLDDGYAPYREGHEITCQFCGKRGLEWGNDGRKWYLINASGYAHKCDKQKILAKTGLDGFEVIDTESNK